MAATIIIITDGTYTRWYFRVFEFDLSGHYTPQAPYIIGHYQRSLLYNEFLTSPE